MLRPQGGKELVYMSSKETGVKGQEFKERLQEVRMEIRCELGEEIY